MKLGARLVIRTIEGLVKNTIIGIPQSQFLKPGETPKPAPKIFPGDCVINWEKAQQRSIILSGVFLPTPCARSYFSNNSSVISFKIFESQPE